MPKFDFSWDQLYASAASVHDRKESVSLREMMLDRNMRWFIKLRWAAVLGLSAGILVPHLSPAFFGSIGIHAPGYGNLLIAALLAAENILLGWRGISRLISTETNIWAQIIVDLVALTTVVHFIGSVGTPIAFLYVLHIALACVFFDTKSSFIVAALSSSMYLLCVTAEQVGVWTPANILSRLQPDALTLGRSVVIVHALIVVGILFLLWYVASRLTTVIMVSEAMQIEAKESAQAAQQERSRLALQMTHQLKSPVDAVESFTQLLEAEFGAAITPKARRLVKKIRLKLTGMRELVLDVLQFSNLEPQSGAGTMSATNVGRLVHNCVRDLKVKADLRGIKIKHTVEDITLDCFAAQIQVLVANLLSNAINYSNDGGTVVVRLAMDPERQCPVLVVSDDGIGIDPEKIPHIFEPYFRTKEAARHNPYSTGIGLALVHRIAQTHNLKVSVESAVGKGTTFTILFPRSEAAPPGESREDNGSGPKESGAEKRGVDTTRGAAASAETKSSSTNTRTHVSNRKE